jgi:hypothetical protein
MGGTMVAVVWHYWIGLALAVGVILTLVAIAAGYVARVEMQKYPKKP